MSQPQTPESAGVSTSVTFLGDFSKKLVTNTFFNFLGRFWNFLITLLLTPYILSHLDVGDFGVWVLLTIFSSTFNLLDLGLGNTFVKYISEYYTRRDYDRINRVLFSGLVFYAAFGVLLTGIGLALEGPLFRLFRISGVPDIFLLVLIGFSFVNISNLFLSVLRGIQRMDKSNAVEIKMSLPSVLGTVVFLEAGMGMLGLAVNGLIMPLITAAFAWWTIKRVVPEISIGWHLDGRLLAEMFKFGAQLQVSRLGGQVCFQVDKLILSRFLGPAAVSFYEVSSRLTSFMRALPLVMMSGLIPATSELDARNDREKILRAYLLASRYVSMLTVALVSVVVIEAGSLLRLWLGAGFEQSVILVQILAIGYGANVMGGAASQTGAGIGKPEFDMKSTILLIGLNPVLSFVLVGEFGPAGAAAGTTLSLIAAAVYLIYIFHRDYLISSAWTVVRDMLLRPVVSGVLASLAVIGFHQLAATVAAMEQVRYLIPVKLALDLAVFSPVYMLLLIVFRQVTSIDRNNFIGLVQFSVGFLRHPLRERVKIYR